MALTIVLALSVLNAGVATLGRISVASSQSEAPLRIYANAPLTWDPARAGDSASAGVLAQVFEGLTTLDPGNTVRPALAESWTVAADNRRIDFRLRPGLHYSDATPITAQHVVDSWLRLLDPARPSPLVSLLADVRGAIEYARGSGERDGVGLRADGNRVVIDLRRPASYFVAVTTSPSLAVVPPAMVGRLDSGQLPEDFVASGGYLPTAQTTSAITLEGNGNYWIGGPPAVDWIEWVTDTDSLSPIDLFEGGELDYAAVGWHDAAWIRYDRLLGPQLRATPDLTIHYYGFDTTRAPFDDNRTRLAFAKAVDWERIVRLSNGVPARSMVPPGLIDTVALDYRPAYDPAEARRLLAELGYAGGQSFPEVSLVSTGFGYEEAVAVELERELGVSVAVELYDFAELLAREADGERAPLWNQAWSADYPHAHDFLGLLLESGSASNLSGWSNPAYDAEIAAAAATADPAEQARHYATAQAILRAEAPVVPVEAFSGFALSRDGLLGALPSGGGYIRLAGLAWAEGSGR